MKPGEVQFGELQAEWESVVGKLESEVVSWEEVFEKVAGEDWEIRQRGRWVQGPANFFGILGRNRDELLHSAMLAWLLNPDGRHGLGGAFLGRLVADHVPGLEAGEFGGGEAVDVVANYLLTLRREFG